MKKFTVGVLSFVLVLSMAACAGKNTEAPTVHDGSTPTFSEQVPLSVRKPKAEEPENENGNVQIPNPWQECSSLDEAGKLAGFSFTAPESIEGLEDRYIAAIQGELAEVIFSSGDDDHASVYFRKGVGTDDISGDCNTYDTEEVQTIGGKTVTCKGSEGLVYNATWNDGGNSYAVMSDTGMDAEQLAAWVQSLS